MTSVITPSLKLGPFHQASETTNARFRGGDASQWFEWSDAHQRELTTLMSDLDFCLVMPQNIEKTILQPLNHLIGRVISEHPAFPDFGDPKNMVPVIVPVMKGLLRIPP